MRRMRIAITAIQKRCCRSLSSAISTPRMAPLNLEDRKSFCGHVKRAEAEHRVKQLILPARGTVDPVVPLRNDRQRTFLELPLLSAARHRPCRCPKERV